MLSTDDSNYRQCLKIAITLSILFTEDRNLSLMQSTDDSNHH